MRRWILPALLLALGLAGWWWRHAWMPTEADRVRSFVEGLAADVSFGPDEGGIAAGRRISRVVESFAPDASVQMDILGAGSFQLSGGPEIQQTMWGARRAARRLEVRFHDIVPEIAPDGQTSTAHLTATAEAHGARRDQEVFEAIEFRFQLRKMAGAWKVQQVETVPTLKQ